MVTSDLGRIERILDPLFLRSPVKIMASNQASATARIESVQKTMEAMQFHATHSLGRSPNYILMAEHNGYEFFLKCDVIDHKQSGSLLKPVRALIKPSQRREERHLLNAEDAAKVFRIMILGEFFSSFSVLNPARDRELRIHKKALLELLPEKSHIEFVLRKSSHMDLRMRTLDKLRLPILIPDKNNPNAFPEANEENDWNFLPFSEYENILRTESWNRSFISEICEPLRYRDALTFGYIRVHSLNLLDTKSYQVVNHIARKLERFIAKQPSLPILPMEPAKVLDISRSGLAFLTPTNKELYQKLQNGESILLELSFPGNKTMAYTAKVRSGFQQGEHLRFGLELIDMSAEQQAAIDDFIAAQAQSEAQSSR